MRIRRSAIGVIVTAACAVASLAPMTAWAGSTTAGGAGGLLAVAAAPWGCHGHSDPPHSLTISGKPGVGYDAYQDCVGAYLSQKVCVSLWYLDYFGYEHQISKVSCGPETVAPHAYWGRSLTCSAIGEGHVRYFTKSTTYAYPQDGTHSSSGASNAAYHC